MTWINSAQTIKFIPFLNYTTTIQGNDPKLEDLSTSKRLESLETKVRILNIFSRNGSSPAKYSDLINFCAKVRNNTLESSALCKLDDTLRSHRSKSITSHVSDRVSPLRFCSEEERWAETASKSVLTVPQINEDEFGTTIACVATSR
ncbi:hypothetical protein AVEN_4520-1 [Araneus ventricosus]|uniref:Uncharacterized protein n=1 Tax=Araneus ventricosus TaxID=182803 RepID=A0A4Y2BKR2_ARAVE|nr:hypothetical protein AVEN_4520-1 [Araneus ventricosus]